MMNMDPLEGALNIKSPAKMATAARTHRMSAPYGR